MSSKLNIDELLQEINSDDRNASRTKKQWANDDDDDWFTPAQSTKKPATTSSFNSSIPKRQDSDGDGIDQDDAWNRTGGSTSAYTPSFGGGTLTNTFTGQGQDTIQRIVGQPRPTTASGPRKFDDIFGSSPPKTTSLGDTDKSKKNVRFDDFDGARPSTAPAPSDTLQNRSGGGVISMLRTGVEPNKSLDMFSSTKPTTETGKKHEWLGLKDTTSDEEDEIETRLPPRPTPKSDSVVANFAKKIPLQPAQEPSTPTINETKKSVLDDMLEMDRQELANKTPATSNVFSTIDRDSLFDGRSTTNKQLPSTSSTFKGISALVEPQQHKPSSRSLFDSKTDFGLADLTFTDKSKDTLFTTDHQLTLTKGNSSSNLQSKKLEFENNELKMIMDHIKKQHETEVAMLDEGYKHRLEYVEKSCERREARLKEENEHLLRQLNDRTQQYENDKASTLLDYQRRLEDLQRDRTTELENLRTLQRQAIDHLRREHEQAIQRLKQLKQEELSTALDVTTHTRAFESVVDHMQQNAKHIDELRLKIEAKHNTVLTDKEIETRAKEQQLKAYEERLLLQGTEFERERKNLQELISRLEVHLSEQTRLVEEERWKALQAQKRMEAMQDALSGEQRLFTEKLTRDRAEVQRGKDQLLDDQKIALTSVYESRSTLAEERAKVEVLQKAFNEQKHRDMLQNATIEAETRAQQKLAIEQLTRLDKREQELIKREEALAIERRSLTELKQRLDAEQSSLKSEHGQLQRKIADIDQLNERLTREKEQLGQVYHEIHALDGKSTGRLNQLQKSIKDLRQQEQSMNEQYSQMAKERQNLNHLRSSIPFKKQIPIIDSGFSTMQLAANSSLLPQHFQQIPQQSIEESALIRNLRMNALQDDMYIEDEMSFIHSIRSGHHLSTRSASLSNLNRNQPTSTLLRTNY